MIAAVSPRVLLENGYDQWYHQFIRDYYYLPITKCWRSAHVRYSSQFLNHLWLPQSHLVYTIIVWIWTQVWRTEDCSLLQCESNTRLGRPCNSFAGSLPKCNVYGKSIFHLISCFRTTKTGPIILSSFHLISLQEMVSFRIVQVHLPDRYMRMVERIFARTVNYLIFSLRFIRFRVKMLVNKSWRNEVRCMHDERCFAWCFCVHSFAKFMTRHCRWVM